MSEIKNGERYAHSELTDTWYIVTRWEWLDKSKGQMKALEKEAIDKSDVPNRLVDDDTQADDTDE